jgi:outer membrane protein OmpA-like peptidoglycan-associated protein
MKRLIFLSVLLLAYPCSVKATPLTSPVRMLALSGKVLNDDSQRPVLSTLTVMVEDYEPTQVITNEQGEFNIMIPVAAQYKVLARAKGFETQEEIIPIPDFEEETSRYIEIKLTPYVKVTLDGSIRNIKDKKPVDAEFNVYYCSDFIKADSKIALDGKFKEPLTHFGWYLVDLSAPGYQTAVDTFWILSYSRKVIHKDYYLSPIEAGFTMQLKNVHFNFNKASITNDSYPTLNDAAQFLQKNPTLQIEVGGHTDNEGPDDYNIFLSQARAQAVVDYLVMKGIRAKQLVAKGYGETKPIDTNTTESGKLKNRRVELVVIHQ